jgi:hypothetical protein
MGSTFDEFTCAGVAEHRGLNRDPQPPPHGRIRHPYSNGPFARLLMPPLPRELGVYLRVVSNQVVYIGQTRTPLAEQLGISGNASASTYNALARKRGRTNGGQQTNCRVNTLANQAVTAGEGVEIWCRPTEAADAAAIEGQLMRLNRVPIWNRPNRR